MCVDVCSNNKYLHLGVRSGTNKILMGFWSDDLESGTNVPATVISTLPALGGGLDTWRHLVFTMQQSNRGRRIYMDSVLVGYDTSSKNLQADPNIIQIGMRKGSAWVSAFEWRRTRTHAHAHAYSW